MPSTSIPVALADKGTTSPTSSKELHPRVYPEPLPAASRAEHVASPLKPYDGAKHLSQARHDSRTAAFASLCAVRHYRTCLFCSRVLW
eukprot:6180520-Pleurochrysis_carterae.AAC.1